MILIANKFNTTANFLSSCDLIQRGPIIRDDGSTFFKQNWTKWTNHNSICSSWFNTIIYDREKEKNIVKMVQVVPGSFRF